MYNIKDKIIESGIILEEDWHKVSKEHVAIAEMILEYLENNKEDDCFSEFEKITFQDSYF